MRLLYQCLALGTTFQGGPLCRFPITGEVAAMQVVELPTRTCHSRRRCKAQSTSRLALLELGEFFCACM
jgi:hypothetical protein